jgi:hypothetical protein
MSMTFRRVRGRGHLLDGQVQVVDQDIIGVRAGSARRVRVDHGHLERQGTVSVHDGDGSRIIMEILCDCIKERDCIFVACIAKCSLYGDLIQIRCHTCSGFPGTGELSDWKLRVEGAGGR